MSGEPKRTSQTADRNQLRPLACLVVEDHLIIGQLLAGMLRTIRGIGGVTLAGTALEAKKAVASQDIDLLVVDLLLPDGNGLDVVRAAIKYQHKIHCIILSNVAHDFVCPKELRPYLTAIIDKTAAVDRLRGAVEEEVREKLGLRNGEWLSDVPRVLSPREMEVFERIGEGMMTRQIADSLGITVHTVNSHRKAIISKLGVVGAELVRMASLYKSDPTMASLPIKHRR